MGDSGVSATDKTTESTKRPYKGSGQYAGGVSKNEIKRRKLSLFPGAKGVFLTVFTPTKARDALREFNNILSRFLHSSVASNQGANAETAKLESDANGSNALTEDSEESVSAASSSSEQADGVPKNEAQETENGDTCEARKADEYSDVVDISSQVNLELKEIEQSNKRFVHMPDIYKNSTFMQFQRSDVPSDIVWRLLTEVKSDPHKYYSRFICRMIPIDHTCKPHMDDFKKMMKPLIADFFKLSKGAISVAKESSAPDMAATGASEAANSTQAESAKLENDKNGNDSTSSASTGSEETEKITWSIDYNSRNGMSTVARQEVYDFITDLMGNEHYKVNLSKAKYTIIVDVSPLICGVSIVQDYLGYFRFNFHRLSHPEEEAANQKMKETQLLKTQNKTNKETVTDETGSKEDGAIKKTEEISSDSVVTAS